MSANSGGEFTEKRKNEIIGLLLIAFGLFSVIALFSDRAGMVGERLSEFFLLFSGLGAYMIPLIIIAAGVFFIRSQKFNSPLRITGFLLAFVSVLSLIHIYLYPAGNVISALDTTDPGGGILGWSVTWVLLTLFGHVGSYIGLITFFIIGILLGLDIFLNSALRDLHKTGRNMFTRSINMVKNTFKKVISAGKKFGVFLFRRKESESDNEDSEQQEPEIIEKEFIPERDAEYYLKKIEQKKAQKSGQKKASEISRQRKNKQSPTAKKSSADKTNKAERTHKKSKDHKTKSQNGPGKRQKEQKDDSGQPSQAGNSSAAEKSAAENQQEYRLPPLDLLQESSPREIKNSGSAELLEETLASFGVQARVTGISQGPTITRYEVQPESGVKVSKIVNLSNDIALALAAPDVRIEAPIPGRGAVGIEVPHQEDMLVGLREILSSEEFKEQESRLGLALGKGIEGKSMVADLASMPHLLVAGATGSGKSVCLNSFITSILYKAAPDEVKLILIDPKKVELSNYKGLPHLFTPVVTDPQKAANVLKLVVEEMEERYEKFSDTSTRGIESYNRKVDSEDKLPYLVVIIDELSDLMMVAASKVEDSICRLAQMSRAAGIHLVIATQRPSVDVITGLIKANIPSRISFAVSSQTDSRTILDMGGAEKLLGNGDMLYAPVDRQKPLRIQGSYIRNEEINRVVEYVKKQTDPEYEVELEEIKEIEVSTEHTKDELYDKAVKLVVQYRASISMLQRKLHIGHSRAARMIDMMEEEGIVGPHAGSKPREVLISEEELEDYLDEYEAKSSPESEDSQVTEQEDSGPGETQNGSGPKTQIEGKKNDPDFEKEGAAAEQHNGEIGSETSADDS